MARSPLESFRRAVPQNLNKIFEFQQGLRPLCHRADRHPSCHPSLTGDDLRVYDLVLRQFLASLMGPATWAVVERIVSDRGGGSTGGGARAKFRTTARSLEIPGFLEALGQEAGKGTTLPRTSSRGKNEVDGTSPSSVMTP